MEKSPEKSTFLCLLHTGAGWHNPASENSLLNLMKNACNACRDVMNTQLENSDEITNKTAYSLKEIEIMFEKFSGLQANLFPIKLVRSFVAVMLAMKLLEDSPLTNCGKGSAFTMDGKVECDVGISFSKLGDKPMFASIGACENIVNPSFAAIRLLLDRILFNSCSKEDRDANYACGLTLPIMLVGAGAYDWAKSRLETKINCHETEENFNKWTRYKKMIDIEKTQVSNLIIKKRRFEEIENHGTVGLTLFDGDYLFAITSSGGCWMKQSGRIGHSALKGASCAVGSRCDYGFSACSTSGNGEQIIEDLLSDKIVCETKLGDDLDEAFVKCLDEFVKDKQHHDELRHAGVVYFNIHDSCMADIMIAHTTKSFAYSYISSNMDDSMTSVSRLYDENLDGKVVKSSCKTIVI